MCKSSHECDRNPLTKKGRGQMAEVSYQQGLIHRERDRIHNQRDRVVYQRVLILREP
ncbi:MAG: hypothetical protein RMX63_19915 [Aulosira sp. ZfuCHP01]|nr:hypothetical protein [Aulosira sp. DedVER01a]MDZ8053698.1 hypothetical protein [Aulosira sp. ZfuCHP01]